MLVRIIGGHGGVSPGFKNTSYLIDGKLLIDAGSVASGLQIDQQVLIDNILISHSHLDHISDLLQPVGSVQLPPMAQFEDLDDDL